MKQKLTRLTELGIEQIEELISLAEEIEKELQDLPIHGRTMKDDKILREVQTILHLAKEIRQSIIRLETIDVLKHQALIVAKIRLLNLI